MPATSAGLPRLLVFLRRALTVLMKQTRQAVRAIKQSILLTCLWIEEIGSFLFLSWCPRWPRQVNSLSLLPMFLPTNVANVKEP